MFDQSDVAKCEKRIESLQSTVNSCCLVSTPFIIAMSVDGRTCGRYITTDNNNHVELTIGKLPNEVMQFSKESAEFEAERLTKKLITPNNECKTILVAVPWKKESGIELARNKITLQMMEKIIESNI
jgi:hypothetical protein